MANATRFKHTQVPRQPEERARLKVIKGPDEGAIYVITGVRAYLGRGEENDVVISDLRASRVHALLSAAPRGWMIEDQGSANGILFEGELSRKFALVSGNVFTVGDTTLEFVASEVGTSVLMAPPKSKDDIQKEQQKSQPQGRRAQPNRTGMPSQLLSGGSNRAKWLVYLVVGVGAYVLLFGMGSGPVQPSKSTEAAGGVAASTVNLASYLPPSQPNKTVDAIFKDGLREYFAGNFNRARTQFETVLQISPGHPLAALYLEKCSGAVSDAVKAQMSFAKKAMEAGKLRESKSHFDRVMRLLYKDQTNPSYIEARDQHQKVSQQLKSEGGGQGYEP